MKIPQIFNKHKNQQQVPEQAVHQLELTQWAVVGIDKENKFHYRIMGMPPFAAVQYLELAKHFIMTAITRQAGTQVLQQDQQPAQPVSPMPPANPA